MSQTSEAQSSTAHSPLQYLKHAFLFLLTFVTATIAGVQWVYKDPFELTNFQSGLTYSSLLLLVLTAHEFGHYFAARVHGVSVTLPYYIPFLSYFGTLGAVIRIRSRVPSRKALFDIGAAGPIAGFIVSLGILAIGFLTLPSKDYLLQIHPQYAELGYIPESGARFGNTILFSVMSSLTPGDAFLPPMNEVYHYPWLCVGWFGLFITAVNLIPIGQLDGGHISYALFGNRYHAIGQSALIGLMVLGTASFLPELGVPYRFGWGGWLFWGVLLALFMKVFKFHRPIVDDIENLDPTRQAIGWLCIVIFVTSFSLTPFTGFGELDFSSTFE